MNTRMTYVAVVCCRTHAPVKADDAVAAGRRSVGPARCVARVDDRRLVELPCLGKRARHWRVRWHRQRRRRRQRWRKRMPARLWHRAVRKLAPVPLGRTGDKLQRREVILDPSHLARTAHHLHLGRHRLQIDAASRRVCPPGVRPQEELRAILMPQSPAVQGAKVSQHTKTVQRKLCMTDEFPVLLSVKRLHSGRLSNMILWMLQWLWPDRLEVNVYAFGKMIPSVPSKHCRCKAKT